MRITMRMKNFPERSLGSYTKQILGLIGSNAQAHTLQITSWHQPVFHVLVCNPTRPDTEHM
ncbi:hypothetical protein A2U01_0013194, partial [Trifolium medium]|nr:hypothetical protein [Trifolium medium]